MAFSLNRIELIGNLGKDAETRVAGNTTVTNFSIATVYGYKGKDDKYVNTTTWHNITAWSLSDYLKEQLKKGKKFFVEGRLVIEEYKDKDGNDKKAYKVIADNIIPLESSNGNTSQNNTADSRPAENNDDLPF